MNISPEEVLTWETETLWNAFQHITNSSDEYKTEKNLVKNGINIKMPIWYITREWHELYPSSKKAKIQGIGKVNLTDFMEEVETRNEIMRNIILENLEKDEIIEGR